jgi:hypothetical protein
LGLITVAIAACTAAGVAGGTDLLDARLTGGERLRDLIGPVDTAVVLLYDPGDCFVCFSELASWIEVRRQRPGLVRIVLTRAPTTTERHQLALYRIVADGVLPLEKGSDGIATPAQLLVVADSIVGLWTAADGALPLLARFRP